MKSFANRKTILQLFFAFLIPVFIFGIALLISRLNGNKILMVFCDSQYQYVEFLLYFRRTILSGESMFYGFNMTLGTEMLPLFAYYLLSPLNFIVCLFPESAVIYAFATIAIIKIGLAGLTFYIFAKENFGKRLSAPVLLACSTAYALCGFVVMYFWQIMWMDAVVILPIVALGLKRLVQGRGMLMYVLALFYGIVTNYYIGFMLCIFSVIWFIYLQKTSGTFRFSQVFRKFIFGSLIAGGMAAVILIPTAVYMVNSGLVGRTNPIPPQNSLTMETVTQFLTGTVTGVSHYVSGPPQVFIGLPMLMFAILYFLNWQVPFKEKWWSGIVIAIILISFEFSPLNSLWHMGTVEVWFPHRYAFLLSFVMIFLAMKCLANWQGVTLRKIMFVPVVGLTLIVWTALCIKWNDEILVRGFEIGIIVVMTVLLVLTKMRLKKIYMVFAVSGVILLQVVNVTMNAVMTEDFLDSRDAVMALTEVEKGEEIGLYRNERTGLWYNDAIMQDRYSVSGFSSANSEKWLTYLKLMGFTKNDNTKIQYNNGTTDGIEDLLAIKMVDGKLNEDAWPMMTVVDARVKEVLPTDAEMKVVRPFEFYNRAFMAMADGGEKVYYLAGTSDVVGQSYCIGTYETWQWHKKIYENDVMKCGEGESSLGRERYVEDAEALSQYHEMVHGVELSRRGAELSGEVAVDDDSRMLMVSLPYSKGWTAYIDGDAVSAEKVLGGLMGFPAATGTHKVVLKFVPPGLYAGMVVSTGSVLILVIYGIMTKRSFLYGKSRKRFNSKKPSSSKA